MLRRALQVMSKLRNESDIISIDCTCIEAVTDFNLFKASNRSNSTQLTSSSVFETSSGEVA